MSIETVSDVVAFVTRNAEFTNSILFADSEVPEIEPDERDAIAAVLDHVRLSFVGILTACRHQMFRKIVDWDFECTAERNWNRDSSIWTRKKVELPLVIDASYVAVAYFWIGDDELAPTGRLSLSGELWCQVRKQAALQQMASTVTEPVFLSRKSTLQVRPIEITEGESFAALANSVVEPLWPLAVDLRAALLST
jgi:hypothetical protein